MSHKYFTINERNKLEVLLKGNYKISKIVKILNRHRTTIYREIKRISGEYSSENAQENTNTKSANKGRNSKITVELKTRFYVAIKMKNRSKSSMPEAIRQLAANILEEAFRTFTSDRGKEFSCWEEVEKLGIEFYFANPYCSWQRGCNENSNGLLREFYPKKTDISKIDTEDLIRTLMLINSRPRKCLNYATLFEKFLHEISKKNW